MNEQLGMELHGQKLRFSNSKRIINYGLAQFTDAIYAGGWSVTAVTEEWAAAPVTAHIRRRYLFLSGGTTLKGFGKAAGIPSATWASVANINQGRTTYTGSATNGTQTATMTAGGDILHYLQQLLHYTELYNGSSLTEVNNLNEGTASMVAEQELAQLFLVDCLLQDQELLTNLGMELMH